MPAVSARPQAASRGRDTNDLAMGTAGGTSEQLHRRRSLSSIDRKPMKQYRHDRTASTVFNDLNYPVTKMPTDKVPSHGQPAV
jgi:hypothetical protein